MHAGRLVASNSSAERIGALTLIAISHFRLPEGQTLHTNQLVNLQPAVSRIVKAYMPLMDSFVEEETVRVEDAGEDTDESEEDEDGEDPNEIDRRSLRRETRSHPQVGEIPKTVRPW